ncbi:hypothetical protein ACWD33_16525 [Streptomyces xiamenensis]|uniref:hypothetical protein n=1 Tax=Streptomyces TaxID=1883 RepID=UPI0004CBCCF1|nr:MULTISPECIES: hypothetical protein [Streptomyces]MCU4748736.1 hypothetical protein [Streptomyces sp. G-5]QQN80196.1 hypothetical protein IPZ77_24355 [Streptomyces sp. XC 2026]
MSPLLDVSDEVRAEIGEAEAARLLAGENAPGTYDCTSCRTPGDTGQERTSTVLFVGGETAVLAFAHAACIPSQVVTVSEEQLRGAVASITGQSTVAEPTAAPGTPLAAELEEATGQVVLGVTCGQILIGEDLYPALVVEPSGPVARPGSDGPGDDFLPLLIEAGFLPVTDVSKAPSQVPGWSVLLAMGQLHSVLQADAATGQTAAWWQAHQPLAVTDGWRSTANQKQTVLVYAAPAGSIGQQPREDLLRDALEKAAAGGLLVAAAMPLAGT